MRQKMLYGLTENHREQLHIVDKNYNNLRVYSWSIISVSVMCWRQEEQAKFKLVLV